MILFVDDDVQVARSLCRLFTAAGYPCRHVRGGAEGLAAVRSHPPRQTVARGARPDHAGDERRGGAEGITGGPGHQTPVVFYSGQRGVAGREEAMALGALAWLPKGGRHVPDTFKVVTESYERAGGTRRERGPASERR